MTSTHPNRFYNPKDGTYANVPFVPQKPDLFRGRRQFNTDVLISNWFEDRAKETKTTYLHDTTYHNDFPGHRGFKPDSELRRKLLIAQEERPNRMILGHHSIDDRKQLITSYDEHYNRRGPHGNDRFPAERKWALQNDCWLPEHSDHPLEGEPTNYGLVEKTTSRTDAFPRSHTLPEISEYTHRYIPHPSQSYSETKRQAISRAYSTALDRTNAINKDMNYRSNSTSSRRQPTTRDVKEIDYLQTFRRDVNVPRTYYYLGKVPDHVDDQMREKFPFLPAPLHSLDEIRQSTIEYLPPPPSSTTATGSVAV